MDILLNFEKSEEFYIIEDLELNRFISDNQCFTRVINKCVDTKPETILHVYQNRENIYYLLSNKKIALDYIFHKYDKNLIYVVLDIESFPDYLDGKDVAAIKIDKPEAFLKYFTEIISSLLNIYTEHKLTLNQEALAEQEVKNKNKLKEKYDLLNYLLPENELNYADVSYIFKCNPNDIKKH